MSTFDRNPNVSGYNPVSSAEVPPPTDGGTNTAHSEAPKATHPTETPSSVEGTPGAANEAPTASMVDLTLELLNNAPIQAHRSTLRQFGEIDLSALDSLPKVADLYLQLFEHRGRLEDYTLSGDELDYSQRIADWKIEWDRTKDRLTAIATIASPYLDELLDRALPKTVSDIRRATGPLDEKQRMLSRLLLAVASLAPECVELLPHQLVTLYRADIAQQRPPRERGLFAIAIELEGRQAGAGVNVVREFYRQPQDSASPDLFPTRVSAARKVATIPADRPITAEEAAALLGIKQGSNGVAHSSDSPKPRRSILTRIWDALND
ncbi:MAG: hypothetical protein QY326_00105 [Bdellovibrionota bacterium]|nr:MAG: hypothetical protein QY326_00105 [Bdellovibrionota bacterium]